ncbi:hydrogenase maturation nickel metallochaperone HypA [Elusimicrobiota bacterium]
MHELGIAKDLWDIIRRNAESNNLKKITKIIIVIGEASGIEEDFLTHSLKDHTLPGTMAEGSALVFEKLPLAAKCKKCNQMITKENISVMACPKCGEKDIEIISGKETYVKNIEGE